MFLKKKKKKKKSNVYECVFQENRQDRDRVVVVQISGNNFCFREWNYFSSLEWGWKNILLYAKVINICMCLRKGNFSEV